MTIRGVRWLAGLGVLLAAGSACAAAPPAGPRPGAPELRLRIAGERTRFRLGERIPVELQFTGAAPDRYRLDAAVSDYSGRVNLDRFQAAPAEQAEDRRV